LEPLMFGQSLIPLRDQSLDLFKQLTRRPFRVGQSGPPDDENREPQPTEDEEGAFKPDQQIEHRKRLALETTSAFDGSEMVGIAARLLEFAGVVKDR
jgi:hypothetical protein